MTETHVIVGASLAGASAAAELRKLGFDGRIVLLGEEDERPYERPELSKKFLRGEPGTDVYVHDGRFYADQGIELRIGQRVDRIDVPGGQVIVGDERVAFDRLLLATGSTPRRPTIRGADLDGVATLRTMADAHHIREMAREATAVAVVGGGWIGSEVAASLRQLGHDVTLVLASSAPLERVLGSRIGSVYAAAHEAHGVRVLARQTVDSFTGRGRVTGVHTAEGVSVRADLVVVGFGAEPRTELASEAGLVVDNGIVVDARLESSVPGIFAAGDVANAWHPRYERRLRVQHWDNAKRQGRVAAANMLGRDVPYERIPYFYSDQYELGMEYRGFAPEWDEVVVRGDLAGGEFLAFWLRSGRVAAAMNVNVWDAGEALDALVGSRAPIDRTTLADPGRPLTELSAA